MPGKILEGKTLANQLKSKVAKKIEEHNLQPTLATILVGEDPASKLYMDLQAEACEEVGITPKKYLLERSIPQVRLMELIHDLNSDEDVNGIIVQLPLPKRFNTTEILQEIDVRKDVDGFTATNLGKIMGGLEGLVPATPKGIMRLLESIDVTFKGKDVVIVNHSVVVGKPLSILFLNRNATVSICHEFTKDLKAYTFKADILISATGVKGLITSDMVKDNAIVIDGGITRTKEGIKGDVKFEQVKSKASHITPVPGGVGPMTIASLLENIVKACKIQKS